MNNLSQYQQANLSNLQNASLEELMVKLYEGMIMRIRQAKERFANQQVTPAKESVLRAMKIADALMDNLNYEEGGDTVQNLEKLYFYIIQELSKANSSEDPIPHLDNSLRVINPLAESFRELERKIHHATSVK